ncbi:MAG TPA: 50S ribosomal protein L10 [Candidatus Binatia bacterium]|nr:50S ribosomal protein L10 [Candidatus Binatia bacterium]
MATAVLAKPKAHVAPYKKDLVKELEALLQKYPIIGIVNMEGLPGAQLGQLKKGLRGKAELFMTKRRLMKIAIEGAKSKVAHLEQIEPLLKGMPALLFTHENPFALYKFLKKSKSPAPAKAGQESPRDIVIPAGPTPFAPGPVISELAAVGIKAGVEGGKVAVRQDSLVIKQGEKFKGPLAAMLTRLGIEPMEIGLNLTHVFEKGVIYDRNVLDIDEVKFMQNLMTAASEAFNLAAEAAFVTADNREMLIAIAFREAKAVALESKFLADAVAADIVEQAARGAIAVAVEAKLEVSHERQAGETKAAHAEHVAAAAEIKKEVKEIIPNTPESHKNAEHMLDELKKKGTLRDKK